MWGCKWYIYIYLDVVISGTSYRGFEGKYELQSWNLVVVEGEEVIASFQDTPHPPAPVKDLFDEFEKAYATAELLKDEPSIQRTNIALKNYLK